MEIFQTFLMKFSQFGDRRCSSFLNIFLGLCPCDREIQKWVPAPRRHTIRGPLLPRQRDRSGVKCVAGYAHFFITGTINASTPQGTPSEKKTSILGTITGGKIKKRSGLLGIFGQNKVSISGLTQSN